MYEADLCLKLVYLFDHAPLIVLFPALRAIVSIMHGAYKNWDVRVFKVRNSIAEVVRKDIQDFFKKDKHCRDQFVFEFSKLEPIVQEVAWQLYPQRVVAKRGDAAKDDEVATTSAS